MLVDPEEADLIQLVRRVQRALHMAPERQVGAACALLGTLIKMVHQAPRVRDEMVLFDMSHSERPTDRNPALIREPMLSYRRNTTIPDATHESLYLAQEAVANATCWMTIWQLRALHCVYCADEPSPPSDEWDVDMATYFVRGCMDYLRVEFEIVDEWVTHEQSRQVLRMIARHVDATMRISFARWFDGVAV